MKEFETAIKKWILHPLAPLLLGLIPCILVVFLHFKSLSALNSLQNDAIYLKTKQHLVEKTSKIETDLIAQMSQADKSYLENQIETLHFLEPEIKKLGALLQTDPNQHEQKNRFDFLNSGKNALRFRQENFQRVGKIQEMEAKQVHPVEMNREDVKALLSRIENVKIGEHLPGNRPPDLLIKQFELIKKPLPSNEEVFLVNVELIKRESLHE